jgi:23S rRNA (adenine2503-C2)-methyltransferase
MAHVYIAESAEGEKIEFVESTRPPYTKEEKWVNIISTLFGCPAGCSFCDAGLQYKRKLSAEEMLFQLEYLVAKKFEPGKVPAKQWKIQFSRMGDPAYNTAVLDLLRILPDQFDAPGLMPSISSIAPRGREKFFDELLEIKNDMYPKRFQFQFSVHTTDSKLRRELIPVPTWNFEQMSEYGERMYLTGGRKITLNFALMKDVPVDADELLKYFNPDTFLIKITPMNPTHSAVRNNLKSLYENPAEAELVINSFCDRGFEVIESYGEDEENEIGSNCGQYVFRLKQDAENPPQKAYSYGFISIPTEVDKPV